VRRVSLLRFSFFICFLIEISLNEGRVPFPAGAF
jgi:hypothetical protein